MWMIQYNYSYIAFWLRILRGNSLIIIKSTVFHNHYNLNYLKRKTCFEESKYWFGRFTNVNCPKNLTFSGDTASLRSWQAHGDVNKRRAHYTRITEHSTTIHTWLRTDSTSTQPAHLTRIAVVYCVFLSDLNPVNTVLDTVHTMVKNSIYLFCLYSINVYWLYEMLSYLRLHILKSVLSFLVHVLTGNYL